jgi:hypothetical protein
MQTSADISIPESGNEVPPQSKPNRTTREVMEAIEKLVESAFSMDTLGIKDKVRSAGVSKFYKKDISDWSPKEKEIDDKIIVTLVPMTEKTPQHYTAKVPWKNGHQPDLISNMEQVRARQNRTCNSGYLESKGTSMDAIDEIFKDYFKKGYIEQVTDETDKKRKDCHYINFFPVVHKDVQGRFQVPPLLLER